MTMDVPDVNILDVAAVVHEYLPQELIEEFRDACVDRVSLFADDYFAELFFVVCSGVTIIFSPRFTFLGAIIGYYAEPYFPSYPFERDRVITVLNASLSGVGAATAIVSLVFTSNTLSLISLVGGAVIENTMSRFCRKYLWC